MGATYRKRGNRSWLVTVHHGGEREFKTVRSEQDARELVRYIAKQELSGINVVEAIRQARETRAAGSPHREYPRLRDALPEWLELQSRAGEIRAATEHLYRSRLKCWCYPHPLPDGRLLGDVTVRPSPARCWAR
jgi:hypothetical protein